MTAKWTPMKWPSSWKEPSMLDLLKGTPLNFLLMEKDEGLAPVAARARVLGIEVSTTGLPPSSVKVLEGVWPGINLSKSGAKDLAAALRAGDPWIDSNGWNIRLNAALNPKAEIWVKAAPQAPYSGESYQTSFADAAVHQGRWIVQLDDKLAAGLAANQPEALGTWKKITGTAGFFAERASWSDYVPEAVLGILSNFSGQNETKGQGILNAMARANQQYRILIKTNLVPSSLLGLKAVLYPDSEAPAIELRNKILDYVKSGGKLIAGSPWGTLPADAKQSGWMRKYELFDFGKGRIAIHRADFDDLNAVANDFAMLISHRYDLLKLFNGGAMTAFYTRQPDGKRAAVQMLFYAPMRGGNPRTVLVAGKYRTGKLWTLDRTEPQQLETQPGANGLECHLPTVSPYAAIELES
jgi:hypothetical protein